MKKTLAIATLGCKVNQYESEAIAEQFTRAGYITVDFSDRADVYIVNTCTVTHLSDRKSRQMIRRAKQKNPDAVLAVMGCYAQTAPEAVLKIPGVDILVGTTGRSRVLSEVEAYLAHKQVINTVETPEEWVFEPLEIDGSSQEHTRAYLKVQDGCNQFCSYCIIPYARGRIRSRSIEDTVKEAQRLAKAGFLELVLTGIHLASWGKDSGEGNLLDLLKALSGVEGIRRIRLGSLEPTLCDEAFVKGVAELPKVCHHFHLSLQSGCNRTLKRMNRKYTAEEYFAAVSRIRQHMPKAAITTDIIVGFPGETETDFKESYDFAEKLALADAHIFKYSPRSGTPAAKMPDQVAPDQKEERSAKLIALTEQMKQRFAEAMLGETEEILFEQQRSPGRWEGKTENYVTVLYQSEKDLSGKLLTLDLISAKHGEITAE